MTVSFYQTPVRSGAPRWPVPEGEKLERAMVAGLMLEVILEAPGLPDDPSNRRRLIKSRLTDSLLGQLAGRITLDRFRSLVHHLHEWFPFYYPLMPPPAPATRPSCAERGDRRNPLVRRDLLKAWLAQASSKLLPRRPQRKIQPERLEDFFQLAQECWFRVKDLALYFDIDRKTAWEYLQKLQEAGLLTHNGGRSAAVRYRLADRFLKVRVAALERQVALALAALPRPLREQAAAWLAATAGEPFWEERWPGRLAAERRAEIISSLLTAAILEVVCQSGRQKLFRLRRRWLRGQG